MYESTEKALEKAPRAAQEELVLHQSDLAACQSDTTVDVTAGTAAEQAAAARVVATRNERAWAQHLTMGLFKGADGRLGRLARFYAWTGDYLTSQARDSGGWHRRLMLLARAVSAREGLDLAFLHRRLPQRGDRHRSG